MTLVLLAILFIVGIFWYYSQLPRRALNSASSQAGRATGTAADMATDTDQDVAGVADEQDPIPPATTVSAQDLAAQAADSSALGGYNVLIADRGNNRVIEVTPGKKIVWEYHFDLPRPGLGADDSFFTDAGRSVIVNLEEYHLIQIIDYATKAVIWSYGVPGKPGHTAGMLNTPDDAYKLANGDVTVADIKNCRVLEIAPDKSLVRQYGQTRDCRNQDGYLNKPNGDTPLADGHTYVSNIVGRDLIELDQNWRPVFTMPLPVSYPSDPQPTRAGNILIADYSHPGQIVEVSKQGTQVWQFSGDASVKLNKPSLAIELPNGNILVNDDLNHRVIVVAKKTKKIIWQYGVTGKPGQSAGQLNTPDGVDIIYRGPAYTVGQVSRHAAVYSGRQVRLQGYVIGRTAGYDIFSDEASGQVGYYDLPVSGPNLDSLQPGQKYLLDGIFVKSAVPAPSGNPYELDLWRPPLLVF